MCRRQCTKCIEYNDLRKVERKNIIIDSIDRLDVIEIAILQFFLLEDLARSWKADNF